jgi:hypothetical protein
MLSELIIVLNVAELKDLGYFGFEASLCLSEGLSGWQSVQVLVLSQIVNIFGELLDEELKGRFRLCSLIKFEAALMEKLMIEHFILDLGPIPAKFLIHALPLLSIAEGNDPV